MIVRLKKDSPAYEGSLSRREFVWFGAAGLLCVFGGPMSEAETLTPATRALDHLLLGVSDLDHGIAWIESLTGVKAAVGGRHPGAGTRNALISLGGKQYLEILAPDPQQTVYTFPVDIREMSEPGLITWAAATSDINSSARLAREAGYQILGPLDGSRARPDGKMLKWSMLRLTNRLAQPGVEPLPFFIHWDAGSLHPSQDSPGGCRLQKFWVEHPDPAGFTEALKKLGIEIEVKRARNIRLKAQLKTSRGMVELS
jgi:glyoxalase-like protein